MRSIHRVPSIVLSAAVLLSSFHPALGQAPPPNVQFLHAFTGGSAGADPVTPVIQTPDGGFAGVTFGLGAFQSTPGQLYTISPKGQFMTLYAFPADGSEGGIDQYYPASLMQASDQKFYGTFPNKGRTNAGVLYRISPTGAYTELHDFANDGFVPLGPLVEAFDGFLYGTTDLGYENGERVPGSIFRVGLDGTFSYVYFFNSPDVQLPSAGLVLGPDGNLYGVAARTVVYKFDPVSVTVSALFSAPAANVISTTLPVLGLDGRLYFSGSNSTFCKSQGGAIISIGLDGSNPSCAFSFTSSGFGASNLMQTSSGLFYSSAADGSLSAMEAVDISAQTVSVFQAPGIGSYLNGNLTQVSNGNLAGATLKGGAGGGAAGTVFLFNTGNAKSPPLILGFQPEAASVGETVTIWGSSLIGTTNVSINGVSALFKTAASGFVSFTVPKGANSGNIVITNAGGAATSNGVLMVK